MTWLIAAVWRRIRRFAYRIWGKILPYIRCPECGRPLHTGAGHTVSVHGCTEEARIAYHREGWEVMRRHYEANNLPDLPPFAPPARADDAKCSGVCLLCEECYHELSPDERVQHYRAWWLEYGVSSRILWHELEAAVRKGE